MKARINYVIAGWTGPRRTNPEVGNHYLDLHLNRLSKLRHSLTQITVVMTYHPSLTHAVRQKMTARNRLGHVPIVYLFRENKGLSYGSWNHAYMQYRGDFDYYFFTEDDYVYVADHFDSTMISMFSSVPKCGYLCTLVKDFPAPREHAAISNGMSSQSVLEKIVNNIGRLQYHEGTHFEDYGGAGQIAFSHAFLDAGYALADITNRFRAPYWEPVTRTVLEFAPARQDYLIKPVQML